MVASRRSGWSAILASLLLLAAITAYGAHHHDEDSGSGLGEHCDLCLQLHATAGAPAEVQVTRAVETAFHVLPVVAGCVPVQLPRHVFQPRAPPGSLSV